MPPPLPTGDSVVVYKHEGELKVAIPRREQTPEEMQKTKHFATEVSRPAGGGGGGVRPHRGMRGWGRGGGVGSEVLTVGEWGVKAMLLAAWLGVS